MITDFDLQVLHTMAARDRDRGAEPLSKTLRVGRDKVQRSINTLRQEGMIKTTHKSFGPGKAFKTIEITEDGYEALGHIAGHIGRAYTPMLRQNNNLYIDTYSLNINRIAAAPLEVEKMEYYESEEERLEAKRKHEKKKHEEKMAQHESRRQEKMVRRNPNNAAGWTATDVAFEFGEQMLNLFHIAPWEVTRSRFRYALSDKRKEYFTDGAIELKMIELFFSKIRHNTKLNDPELVWKRFIIEFGVLFEEAKRQMVSPEQVEQIKEEARKSQEWLLND